MVFERERDWRIVSVIGWYLVEARVGSRMVEKWRSILPGFCGRKQTVLEVGSAIYRREPITIEDIEGCSRLLNNVRPGDVRCKRTVTTRPFA